MELARRCDLDVQTLSRHERGEVEPTDESLDKLARALDFPPEFFRADAVQELAAEHASFRAMKSMTARQRDAALGAGTIALELNYWVEKKFKLQVPDVPSFERLKPELAAEATRRAWKLGVGHAGNMVHLLELHGVRVFSLAEDCREVNAFSLWRDDKPFVFLNTMKSVERSRFDAAHELGHLVMHRDRDDGEQEHEADRFASAFLMPEESVKLLAPKLPSLTEIVRAKRRWDVSAAALTRRMYDVKLISEWTYRSLYLHMSELGYRTNEPSPMSQRETSQVWTKVFASLRKEGKAKSDVARELRIPVKELDAIVFGLIVMGTIEGGGQSSGASKARLRMV